MPKVRQPDGSFLDVDLSAIFADDGINPFATTPTAPPGNVYTEADLQKVREDEKGKLYSRLEDLQSQVGTLTAAQEQERQRLETEQAAREAEARRLEEESLSAKDLVARKDQEWRKQLEETESNWSNQLAEEKQARLAVEAEREKERQFNDLRDYARAQVEANQENIAPQLLGWIQGNSREEIDSAIARAVTTTAEIVAEVAPLQQQQVAVGPDGFPVPPQQQFAPQPPALPGTRITAAPGEDPTQQYQQLSPEQIKNMPMDQYAEFRRRAGIGGQTNARGMFS